MSVDCSSSVVVMVNTEPPMKTSTNFLDIMAMVLVVLIN